MLEKTRSRSLIKRRKSNVIARKSKFKAQDNPFKTYHKKRPEYEIRRYAESCRADRLSNPTTAEREFEIILIELGAGYEKEKIIYYAGGSKFILADFFLTGSGRIIEIDGSVHATQSKCDVQRDKYFDGIGHPTTRFTNKEVLKTPEKVKEIVRCFLKEKS